MSTPAPVAPPLPLVELTDGSFALPRAIRSLILAPRPPADSVRRPYEGAGR